MHFGRSPACLEFFHHSTTVGNKRAPPGDSDAIFTSSKRASVLRRDVVNPMSHDARHFPMDAAASATINGPPPPCNPELSDDLEFPMVDDEEEEGYNWEQRDTVPTVPLAKAEPWLYTTDQKWTIALLKLLDDMNAPDYAFTSVLRWARGATAAGYSFYPDGGLSRSRSIDCLFATVKNAKQLLPSVARVNVPHGPPCDVIVFEFVPQLLRLLQNRNLMTTDKLVIDPLNPLIPYAAPNGELGDALSGQVYRDAYTKYITNPQRQQFFVPIIQWIDRTSVTGNDRFSLKPYMFTPAIFKETFRRRIEAWGYHGFLPKRKTSSAQNQTQSQGNNIRNYHAELYTVLQSVTMAGPQLRDVMLPLGPTGSMCVDVVTCILFVIQDMQEGDALCGRFGTHTIGIQRHCRACDVSTKQLDYPNAACSFLLAADMALIAHNDDKAVRTRWSQHFLNNVFDHVPLADPVRGIYGATPMETLHAFRKGLIEKVTLMVLKNVPVSKQAALDVLAVQFHRTHRQTYRKVYPATDFSNGITNLTKISAAERVGLLFLFVILSQYDEGWMVLSTALQKKDRTSLRKVIGVFEALLCFDQWLNKPTYWPAEYHTESKLKVGAAISKLMSMCKADIPLADGKTWKFPKFHELLHVVNDMERFGAPVNYCAQRPESLLIPVAKQPGRRAQKRHAGSTYELQAAQRLSYSLMIDEVHSRIWGAPVDTTTSTPTTIAGDDDPHIFESTGMATFGVLTRDNDNALHVHWNTRTNTNLMQLPAPLLEFLWRSFGPCVKLCTEYVRDTCTFRCHPAYQSDNAINDWMHVQFMVYNRKRKKEVRRSFPCRLAAVVLRDIDETNMEPYHLIVQSASRKTGIKSTLLTEWAGSPEYLVILPSSIVSPCFVVIIKDDTSKILETLPLDKWPSEFTKPVEDESENSDSSDEE